MKGVNMRITDEEKRILDGQKGKVAQKCMQFMVDYGEAAGAEYLVDLDGTVDMHPGPGWVGNYDVTREELQELIQKGERCLTNIINLLKQLRIIIRFLIRIIIRRSVLTGLN